MNTAGMQAISQSKRLSHYLSHNLTTLVVGMADWKCHPGDDVLSGIFYIGHVLWVTTSPVCFGWVVKVSDLMRYCLTAAHCLILFTPSCCMLNELAPSKPKPQLLLILLHLEPSSRDATHAGVGFSVMWLFESYIVL